MNDINEKMAARQSLNTNITYRLHLKRNGWTILDNFVLPFSESAPQFALLDRIRMEFIFQLNPLLKPHQRF